LLAIVEAALSGVITGELDARKAMAVASLSSLALKIYETGALEQRLRELEEDSHGSAAANC